MDKRTFIAIGLLTMSFNSLYQYSWNVFEPLLKTGLNVSLVEISIGFTLFAIFSTSFQSVGGYFADTRGPKTIGIVAAVLSALGYLGTSFINNIYDFYVLWSIGSIGEGILYGISTNLAVKWFPSRRGLSTGLVSLGFGLGATIANIFIVSFVSFRTPMLIVGMLEIILLPSMMFFTKYPEVKMPSRKQNKKDMANPKFWYMYTAFTLSIVPLTVISSSFGYIGNKLPLIEFTILISLFPLFSGISRPILGHASDKIGRINTLLISNIMMVIGSIFLIMRIYVIAISLIGFFGGATISLYFSAVGDLFGSAYSTVYNGIIYTGKAISGILGSTVFAIIYTINKDYSYVFTLLTALSATVILIMIIKLDKRNSLNNEAI